MYVLFVVKHPVTSDFAPHSHVPGHTTFEAVTENKNLSALIRTSSYLSSTPHPISLSSMLISSSHLHLYSLVLCLMTLTVTLIMKCCTGVLISP